jgi:hypothetical protein
LVRRLFSVTELHIYFYQISPTPDFDALRTSFVIAIRVVMWCCPTQVQARDKRPMAAGTLAYSPLTISP